MKTQILQNKKSTKSLIEPYPLLTLYDQMRKDTSNTKNLLLKQLIDMCYNNKQNQMILCRILNLSYQSGNISINAIPSEMFQKYNLLKQILAQIQNLKIDEIRDKKYACWIVINQPQQLSLVFITKNELKNNIHLLDYNKNYIGIFVFRELINIQSNKMLKKRQQEKTNKTTATNNTDNTNTTHQSLLKRKKKKVQDWGQEKLKSCSLKVERKLKSKSSKKEIRQLNKSTKYKSTYIKIPKQNQIKALNSPVFDQKIMSKKNKEQKKQPLLYNKKLQLSCQVSKPKLI